MKRFVSLVAVRRTRIARFFAALLIVLTAAPFTAPFSVLAVAEMLGEQSIHQADGAASKTLDDLTDLRCFQPGIRPASLDCGPCAVCSLRHADPRAFSLLVLRI